MNTLDILKQIICEEMELPDDRVLTNNSSDVPTDSGLFIKLYYGMLNPISNNVKYVETVDGVEEHQSMNVCEEVFISVMSQNTEACERVHEVQMAFNSTFSRNLQAKEHIYISILGDVSNASEATSHRFDVKTKVFRSYSKIKSVDYYDKYQFETWTNLQDGQVILNKIPK